MASEVAVQKTKKVGFLLTFAEVALGFIIVGLCIGLVFCGAEVIKISKLRAQMSQIAHFDEAIAQFYEKYEGLPGDLLAAKAEREGLVTGDGTPSHSDGDGKISPCNPGWQYHIGCETALFWAQLASAGFISGNYTADSRLADERLDKVSVTMAPYLPVSPIDDGVYITVWNSDEMQPSPEPRLPYGNYFEVTRIAGVHKERIKENTGALSPLEARAIDNKMDDGSPWSGRIKVNGNTSWPDDTWGMLSRAGATNCVYLDHTYNNRNYFLAHRPLCHLAIAFTCCENKDR